MLVMKLEKQDPQRWSKRVWLWNPETLFDGVIGKAKRKQARPCRRWMDDIRTFNRLQTGHDFIHGDWREKRPETHADEC